MSNTTPLAVQRVRVFASVCACVAFVASANAALLDFSQQIGSQKWNDYAAGSAWRFEEVQDGLDMILTLDSLTPDSKLQVHPLGDQLKVTVKGRTGADHFAEFTASFVDAEFGVPVALAPNFLLTDIDFKKNKFAETVWFDHVESYSLTDDSHVVASINRDRVIGQGARLDTSGKDDRAWLGVQLSTTSSFSFGWGFEGLKNGKGGYQQRGLEFGGTAVADFSRGHDVQVPEPASLVLLSVCLLLRRR